MKEIKAEETTEMLVNLTKIMDKFDVKEIKNIKSISKLTTADVKAKLPSALCNQCIRDAKSIVKKYDKACKEVEKAKKNKKNKKSKKNKNSKNVKEVEEIMLLYQ